MKKTASVMIIIAAAALLADPSVAARAVRDSLKLCAESVIPSLFCYMVISKTALGVDAARYVRGLFRPLSRVLKLTDDEASCAIIGNLCGFPAGAATAGEVICKRNFDYRRKTTLSALSNNVSAAFSVSYIGGSLLGSYALGAVIYGSQLISALIVGVISRRKLKTPSEIADKKSIDASFSEIFCSAVVDGASSTLNLAGFIVTFSVIGAYFEKLLEMIGVHKESAALASSLLEISSGCRSASLLPVNISAPYMAFLCSFSGLCVIFQSAVYLSKCGIRIRDYVRLKIVQGLFAYVICTAVMLFADLRQTGDVVISYGSKAAALAVSAAILLFYLVMRIKRVFVKT